MVIRYHAFIHVNIIFYGNIVITYNVLFALTVRTGFKMGALLLDIINTHPGMNQQCHDVIHLFFRRKRLLALLAMGESKGGALI